MFTALAYLVLLFGTSEILAYTKMIQPKDLIDKTVNPLIYELGLATIVFFVGIFTA